MLEYAIIQKKEVLNIIPDIQHEQISFIQKGYIDINNLKETEFSEFLKYISEDNQQELIEKGTVEYAVITTTIVLLESRSTK